MAKFTHRPLRVDARQFAGGIESGHEMVEWVISLGGRAFYVSANEAYPATEEVKKNARSALPEQLHLCTSDGYPSYRVDAGEWVVRTSDGTFKVYPPELFTAKFKKVKEKD